MARLRWLLFPFSALYGWMMRMRNRQYDSGQRPVVEFEPVIISVGNLSVGGTGKTPMIEWLIRQLKGHHKLATISRGYGRKTRGFRLANDEDNARTIGDEPLQFYRKFGEEILVTVSEERILAVPAVLGDHEEVNVFLLDDAFQHRKIGRDLNIMLTAYDRPFYNDYVVPAGRLREERMGAARADIVVVTKCPSGLVQTQKDTISKEVRAYSGNTPVYFSEIAYGKPQLALGSESTIGAEVAVLTGIAHPDSFLAHLEKDLKIKTHFNFQDHYAFTKSDLDKMEKTLNNLNTTQLITTEKDMVRLLSFKDHSLFKKVSLFCVPIEFAIDREEEFREKVLKVIESN